MPNTTQYDQRNDRVASLLQNTIDALGPELVANPQLAEVLNRMIDDRLRQDDAAQNAQPLPGDGGLADLMGLGPTSPTDLGQAQVSSGVVDYDDTVTSDRILSTGDLYYIYMHERIGV